MEHFNIINKLILAPMVRIGTLPFRKLCLSHGADIIFTEEIIDKKLIGCQKIYNEELKTNDYIYKDGTLALRIHEEERNNLILQIGTSSAKSALEAALLVKDDVIGIDVNMGCPKHFSTHGNMGSSLLALPDLVKEIRLLEDMKKTLKFVDVIQNTGIKFFTVHLRYRLINDRKKDQTARNMADWKSLIQIKNHSKIPVIANGDILSKEDMVKLKRLTNCDGFMIARGAIHNPKLFSEYKEFISKGENLKIYELDNDNEEIEEMEQIRELNQNINKSVNNEKSKSQNTKKTKEEENDLQFSQKLSKIFEKKYCQQKIEIFSLCKQYLEFAIKSANAYGNTKYVILYIIKTHKDQVELFKRIQTIQSYPELCDQFGLKEFYLKFIDDNKFIIKYIDGSYYKALFQQDKKKNNDKQSIDFLTEGSKKKKVEDQ